MGKHKDERLLLNLLRQVAIDEGIKIGKFFAEQVWQTQQIVAKQHYQKLIEQHAKNLARFLSQSGSLLTKSKKNKGSQSRGGSHTSTATPVIPANIVGSVKHSQNRISAPSVPASPSGMGFLVVLSLAIVVTGVSLNFPRIVDATQSISCTLFQLCEEKPEFPGYGAEQ